MSIPIWKAPEQKTQNKQAKKQNQTKQNCFS